MSRNPAPNVVQRSFAAGATSQNGRGARHNSPLGGAQMLPNAHSLNIASSTFTAVGGDVVNDHSHHYHYERSRDIRAILESIPNFRNIYHDMLSKATLGTGMWLVKGDKFRLWLEPNGDIKIFWGSGIPGAGKTLLASIVIEHLEALCEESDARVCVCYIYFRYSDHSELTDGDIDLHIAKGINKNAELRRLLQVNTSLREEVISTVKGNCGGMFLHAPLQLEALGECFSAQDVRNTLKVFPSSIEDVYRQTWARITNEGCKHTTLAQAVLVWVLNASRPMTIDELERAVATSPDTYKFEIDRLVPGATLISLCGGLVTVEEESRLVRLVHYTAKETLENLLHEPFPHPHSLLAAVCMTHLIECGFQNTTISSEEEFKTLLEKDPLLAYASEAWAFHAVAGLDKAMRSLPSPVLTAPGISTFSLPSIFWDSTICHWN
ncbi:hypothetical protein BKA70DRAFT_1395850 [Coprinopsis sp. MPI-PUGE-AT-0042]|nr:hypothetical protein BKA70DRAFT_1395850 [Coprinopsis sp. MPI-PUGE-AT-0042]